MSVVLLKVRAGFCRSVTELIGRHHSLVRQKPVFDLVVKDGGELRGHRTGFHLVELESRSNTAVTLKKIPICICLLL